MTPEFAHWTMLAARLLMGGFYALAGIHHFLAIDALAGMIAKRNVPAPKFVLISGSLFQIAAGLLLMIGCYQLFAAIGLIVFTLAASVMLLNFWDNAGDQRRNAATQWQCNVALIGGLLAFAAAS